MQEFSVALLNWYPLKPLGVRDKDMLLAVPEWGQQRVRQSVFCYTGTGSLFQLPTSEITVPYCVWPVRHNLSS